jgi:NAD(P)-dependent dehydrogenase (short-subunit alcohol dehydrogenase family)
MSTESASAPVALVTGADKGIGLETARRLAGPGTGCISPPAAATADGPPPRPQARSSWNWT